MAPLVSVVTATYNRSNVLRLTVESVLASSFSDWEMIVVGDACTDDTAAMIEAVHDPRIRFVNLSSNHGEQSRPNNEGLRLARGRYIAFLNHDDLWTNHHLAVTVAELEKGTAPFVHTLALTVPADGVATISGSTHTGLYEPYAFAPASSWVFRKELAARVGDWRPARSLFIAPSADWLHRAWKARIPMRTISEVTVVCVLSGGRQNCYAERHATENEHWARALRDDPNFLLKQVTAVAARTTRHDLSIVPHLGRAAKNAVRRLTFACGLHPYFFRTLLYGRPGSFIDRLRRTRGLPPLPRGEVTS
jgi:glycosyltransferase involved in cell wall biosynthesis